MHTFVEILTKYRDYVSRGRGFQGGIDGVVHPAASLAESFGFLFRTAQATIITCTVETL